MAAAAVQQSDTLPASKAYEPPRLEVLGQLTDLAEGQGEDGQLIVMQTGAIPGGDAFN
ncbi:MAG TPA: hypothetical protein VGD91_19015 [Trebonia sp.]